MEELIKMGYTREGSLYVKPLGEYRITVFSVGNSMIRRITNNGAVIDTRKVSIKNLETDRVIQAILKDLPLSVSNNPTIAGDKEAPIKRYLVGKSLSGELI